MKSQAVIHYISQHWAGFILVAGVIFSPLVMSMPDRPPKSVQDWWTWLYDYVHALSNSRNTRLSQQPIPTPPVNTTAAK